MKDATIGLVAGNEPAALWFRCGPAQGLTGKLGKFNSKYIESIKIARPISRACSTNFPHWGQLYQRCLRPPLHEPGLTVNPGWLASPGQTGYEQISISVYTIAGSTFHTSPTRSTLLETRVDPGWRGVNVWKFYSFLHVKPGWLNPGSCKVR